MKLISNDPESTNVMRVSVFGIKQFTELTILKIMINTIKRLVGKPKYNFFYKEFKNTSFRLLDIGGGSGDSGLEVGTFFPNCQYFCIDMIEERTYFEKAKMTTQRYWRKNLELLDFDDIPDDYFDAFSITHVIEHLRNGDIVLERILPKIRKGGVIYIEYPCFWSTKLPSLPGTLNFFDDETHVRLYSLPEIYNVLLKSGCIPESAGTRRNWYRLLCFPVLAPYKLLKTPDRIAYEFWDLLGFAEYVFARKK